MDTVVHLVVGNSGEEVYSLAQVFIVSGMVLLKFRAASVNVTQQALNLTMKVQVLRGAPILTNGDGACVHMRH